MDKETFKLEMSVRDYECDLQGIVNNAVYQNYLEHTRHQFLLSVGLDFAKLHEEGTDAMVSRALIDYKWSLTSGDEFICTCNLKENGRLRLDFVQKIFRKKDEKLCISAVITGVCIKDGRPIPMGELFTGLERFFLDD